ncbi:hypothetical protein PW52_16865 [Tamlana sedimentorum]|uniref:Uncharacterized protein n=1 Tax=Neotamlana sedimentorum TaxID=1435349 RepID=A0A0D7VVW6_9FLAO|nr:hypothetical protein [Tamlana sedimentorum]KJD31020.1 hypothetical protein PW52_16865 [Tamlana sedimentorum]
MSIEQEQAFIEIKKSEFKTIFNKNADDNLTEFLMYLNNVSNRELSGDLYNLSKEIEELSKVILRDSAS